MKTQKAIFLDRDGTLILDKNYLSRIEDIEYFPDTMKALQLMQQLGYGIFVVTNQSGVGRGFFSLDAVHAIHHQMQSDLKENLLLPIKDFAICPHSPEENCTCRKPSGKMIQELMSRHSLSPQESYMAGDKLIDAECGKNAGTNGVLVRTQHKSDFLSFKTLLEFAHYLKSKA